MKDTCFTYKVSGDGPWPRRDNHFIMRDEMKHESSPKFDLHERVYIEPTACCEGFQTQIVGLEESRWLILKHSFSDSWLHRLRPKDLIWGRYFKGAAIRFMTKVINTIENPIPLIFLEYPSVVEESNRRGSERKKTFIDCQVCDPRPHHSRHSWEGYILDISKSGCLILGGFVNLLDRDILLSFRLPLIGYGYQSESPGGAVRSF
jgi:hypothetical protein